MHEPDFAEFRGVLDSLSWVFAPGKPMPDDDRVQVYWRALRDLSLQTVKLRADACIRYGKFFPKPSELRPKEDQKPTKTPAQQASFDDAVRYNQETWNLWLEREPEKARHALLAAYVARVDVSHDHSSVIYAERMKFATEAAARRGIRL